jgi:hypothetical protein
MRRCSVMCLAHGFVPEVSEADSEASVPRLLMPSNDASCDARSTEPVTCDRHVWALWTSQAGPGQDAPGRHHHHRPSPPAPPRIWPRYARPSRRSILLFDIHSSLASMEPRAESP